MTARPDNPGDDPLYVFDVVLHPRPAGAAVGGESADPWGRWRVLAVPREELQEPFAREFDAVLADLARLPRMYVEPDGAILWTSSSPKRPWQVDGTLAERTGRVLAAELKGCCPRADFDRLLEVFGWPKDPVIVQLVRAGVFLDEQTFRHHATARGALAAG